MSGEYQEKQKQESWITLCFTLVFSNNPDTGSKRPNCEMTQKNKSTRNQKGTKKAQNKSK